MSDVLAPSGQPWAYGIRTWDKGGKSHDGFQWDLALGARTTAPDWNARPVCGYGLHANEDGWGDWALLGLGDGEKVLGVVRWDSADSVRIDGNDKSKAPWMEIVLTSETASLASIYGFISARWQERTKVEKLESTATGDSGHAAATGYSGHAAATGDSGHAAATGDRGHAAATGDRGHAAATGDRGHAAAEGKFGIAVSLGGGSARASDTGAITLTRWGDVDGAYALLDIAAGMVGQELRGVTLFPGVAYRLNNAGVPEEVRA